MFWSSMGQTKRMSMSISELFRFSASCPSTQCHRCVYCLLIHSTVTKISAKLIHVRACVRACVCVCVERERDRQVHNAEKF